jgi:2',3'-cyclic-nucleotide 2'-phosphodiesterase
MGVGHGNSHAIDESWLGAEIASRKLLLSCLINLFGIWHRHPMHTLLPEKCKDHLRIVLIGDIVGKPGMTIACRAVPRLKDCGCDLIVANAENAADGTGLTVKQYEQLIASGVHAITLGDHIYKKREISQVLRTQSNIVKPANFPQQAPGRDHCVVETECGVRVGILSLLGRVFMRPVNCPFEAADRVLNSAGDDIRIWMVDLHAEATSDKQSMGYYLDGRVSAVLGTHTHVPTADEQILPLGTAFQCDVGMTGPYRSILGREIEPVLNTTLTFDPNTFHVATEDVRLSATWFDVDPNTGKASAIGRIHWRWEELISGAPLQTRVTAL